MQDINEKCYGGFGWRQFWQNRVNILSEYDRLKALNKNHLVKTSHGVALEAQLREWLGNLIPKKYGITSGYIIPDIVVGNYTLRHYDIIIYNQLESPTLWIEDTKDNSSVGQKKAIPAKYVNAVIEVKSTFNKKSIVESFKKLSELNELKEYLNSNFRSFTIFAELGNDVPNNPKILENFVDFKYLVGYTNSLILRSNVDDHASGTISLSFPTDQEDTQNLDLTLTKAIDELDIYKVGKNLKVDGRGAGVKLHATSLNVWSITKTYSPMIIKNKTFVSLSWSHNEFTNFFLKMLNAIEGLDSFDVENKDKINFGRVYDKIKTKK